MKVTIHKLFEYLLETAGEEPPECVLGFSLSQSPTLGEFLPEVLKRYLATHPDVNIDLQEKLSNEIVRAVMDGKTDIGIVAGSVRTENLQTLPYRSDSLVLVVPRATISSSMAA